MRQVRAKAVLILSKLFAVDPPFNIISPTTKKTSRTAQKVEENIRFTKLIFPISRGSFWNGNGFNYLAEKEYYYDSINESSTFGLNSFDSTVYVIQNSNNNLLEFDEAYEVYAKNIGLVYKKDVELNINFGNVLDINEGYEFEQVILNY